MLVFLLRQFLVHHHQGRRDEGADARKGGEDEKATVAKGLLKRAGEHHGNHDRHGDQRHAQGVGGHSFHLAVIYEVMQVGACAEAAGRLGDERAARYPAYVGGQGVAEKDVEEWGDAGGERHDGERVAESGLSKKPDAKHAAGDEAEDAHRSLYIAKLLRRQCQSAAAPQVEHEQDGDGCEQRTGQQEHAQEKDARPRTRGSDEVGAGVEAGVEHVCHSYLPLSVIGTRLWYHEDVPHQHDGEDAA